MTGGSESHMQQRLWGETAVYVDNDVDVDDVDDEEGATAYFFWSETAMAIPTVNYKSVRFFNVSIQKGFFSKT